MKKLLVLLVHLDLKMKVRKNHFIVSLRMKMYRNGTFMVINVHLCQDFDKFLNPENIWNFIVLGIKKFFFLSV